MSEIEINHFAFFRVIHDIYRYFHYIRHESSLSTNFIQLDVEAFLHSRLYVVSFEHLIEMTSLKTHEELKEDGTLEPWNVAWTGRPVTIPHWRCDQHSFHTWKKTPNTYHYWVAL